MSRDTRRPMERFFPSRVIKSLQGQIAQLHFDKFFSFPLIYILIYICNDQHTGRKASAHCTLVGKASAHCTLDTETSN